MDPNWVMPQGSFSFTLHLPTGPFALVGLSGPLDPHMGPQNAWKETAGGEVGSMFQRPSFLNQQLLVYIWVASISLLATKLAKTKLKSYLVDDSKTG